MGEKVKKVLKIIGNVLIYVFLFVSVFLVILTLSTKKTDQDAMSLFGTQMRIVQTASMEECDQTDVSGYDIKSIPVMSMVFIETVPTEQSKAIEWYENLKVGDVCTFQYKLPTTSKHVIITHRIIEKIPLGDSPEDGYKILLQGDNKSDEDNVEMGIQTINTANVNSLNYIIGKVTGQSRVLGFITYIVKQPIGMVLVVIVPCAIIMILEIIKIVGILGAEKKEKAKAQEEARQSEIEDLKRQLAALQNAQASPETPSVSVQETEPNISQEQSPDEETASPKSDDSK